MQELKTPQNRKKVKELLFHTNSLPCLEEGGRRLTAHLATASASANRRLECVSQGLRVSGVEGQQRFAETVQPLSSQSLAASRHARFRKQRRAAEAVCRNLLAGWLCAGC